MTANVIEEKHELSAHRCVCFLSDYKLVFAIALLSQRRDKAKERMYVCMEKILSISSGLL